MMGESGRQDLEPLIHRPETTAGSILPAPSLRCLFFSFLRLGVVSFGGPAMVAFIGRLAVTHKKWLGEDDFQQGVALCQAVPGATAMQCAAYVGLRARGLLGAVSTYVGFGLPAFLLMLSLSIAYRHTAQLQAMTSTLAGLRALVVALVANAAWTFGRSSVRRFRDGAIALATGSLFLLGSSPFWIVAAAGLAGALLLRGSAPGPKPEREAPPPGWKALRAPALIMALGALLVVALTLLDSRLASLGLVMMKVDLFAFGGGFASVPLMFHEIVDVRGWVPAHVFMDGLALGQVTPGPIVITATFVGHQVAGLAGALVGTACIFWPSFFMVVLAEPWFLRFSSSAMFRGAIRGFLLSFVGLLGAVTVQFVRLTPWTAPSAIIASLALTALLFRINVLWVVLGGVVLSALVI